MSQDSLILPTTGLVSGLTLVQAINAALGNVSGSCSGTSDPSTLPGGVKPFSLWADTSVTPATLRYRNAANTTWTVFGDLTQTNLGLGVPAGMVTVYAGATVPAGFLAIPPAASTVSRAVYANLFAAIGTSWGVGDGSTTFNIPFVPNGYTLLQGTLAALSAGVMPSHSHAYLNPASNAFGYTPGATPAFGWDGSSTADTQASGSGSANLAAGVAFKLCIKY